MAVLFLTVGSALAQVIITDEDVNHNRATRDAEEFGVMVPMQKFDGDQWKVAPLATASCCWPDWAPPTSCASAKRNKE